MRCHTEPVTVLEHPGAARPEFQRIAAAMAGLAALQLFWAALIFYMSTHPVAFADTLEFPFTPGLIYSIYSSVHALYTLLGVFLAVFLRSRHWMRAAALACSIPGPGFAFGILQVPAGILIFRRLGQERWALFFRWHESIGRPRERE